MTVQPAQPAEDRARQGRRAAGHRLLLAATALAIAGAATACASGTGAPTQEAAATGGELSAFKEARGIPRDAWSCHTAVIDGYIVEGHVPVEAIDDLLAERPDIDGIALPGMPPGSPGMPGEKAAPFEVLAIDDGTITAFGEY